MARALPRTSFNSSRLIRFLADLAVAEAVDRADPNRAKQSFAERLGLWLDLNDAISLSAAVNSGAAGGTEVRSAAPSAASVALREDLARRRTALADSITGGKARTKLPVPAPGTSIEDAADFSLYRRYYLALQRDMEAAIGPLRANARNALSRHSPAQRRLALLDVALDNALSVRERSLLATVPSLLEKRYARLRQAHQAALADGQADGPDRWMQPGGWLAVFCQDMQGALLAELDVRLQPVIGLIEALGTEAPSRGNNAT